MIYLDFETYYDKEYSLRKMTMEEYIRDPRFEVIGVCVKIDDCPTRWITGETAVIKDALDKYHMENEQVVAHNAAFDAAILSWKFDIHPKMLFDTMSMARPHTDLICGASLKELAKHYQIGEKGEEIYNTLGKRREDFTEDDLKRFGEYCVQDVELTHDLFALLVKETPMRELYLIDLTLKMFTEPKIILNKDNLDNHLQAVRQEKADLLASVGNDRKDLMSNPKFAKLLEAEGVDPPKKISKTTGKETYAFAKTDADFLALKDHPNQRVQALVAARLGTKSTLEETRTERFADVAERGALPVLLHYYGATTGRFSGGQRLNLQNLPRGGELRNSICAPAGHSIVACDSSNIEARLNAFFCGQDDLVEQLREGKDIYCEFASKVYNRPITKADKNERFIGKTCLAANTEVLTNHGWKFIINVTKDDLLWDGKTWVKHQGVVSQGNRKTLSIYGLRATPDHLCWTGTQFLPWAELVKDGRVFQQALTAATLPSLDTATTSEVKTETEPSAGKHTVLARAVGRALCLLST